MTVDTSKYAPRFKVKINNSDLPPDVHDHIMSVTINDKQDQADMFNLKIYNKDLRWIEKDPDQFCEGNLVEIEFGYHPKYKKMISGEITRISFTFPESGVPTMTAEGYSKLHRLNRCRLTKPFENKKDSQIAQTIAQSLGLKAEVDDSKFVHEHVRPNNQTVLEFLKQRAKRIGFEVKVDGDTLYFQKPKPDESPICALEWGKNLKSFTPTINTAKQINRVVVKGYNPKTKQKIEAIAKRGDEETKMAGVKSGIEITQKAFKLKCEDEKNEKVVNEQTLASQEEAEAIAKAYLNREVLGFITGKVSCMGDPEIKAGKVVELKGLGKRFNGKYIVTSATHTISDSGYSTSFEVKRSAT